MGEPNRLLRRAREDRGWAQEEVAEKIGTTGVSISRWENRLVEPSKHYRHKLCDLFEKSEAELGLAIRPAGEQLARPVFLFNWNHLPTPAELYGRQRARKTLLARTLHRASTSLTGPRRIGKTWLLQYLLAVAPKQLGAGFRLGYLDAMAPECETIEGFAAAALERLKLPTPLPHEGLIGLKQGLRHLVTQKQTPVLCIDEFDCIGRNSKFTREFYEGLRSLCSAPDPGLVLVLASQEPLHLLTRPHAHGSPFFNIFERVALKPFSYSETEQFIAEKGQAAGFTPQERAYLWEYGKLNKEEQAWWPLRLQLAGKILEEEDPRLRKLPEFRAVFEESFLMCYEATIPQRRE
ncbi:MAG TPA: helix-turn-helix domain-containing protein [Ktedonosporobacter sp.]|nr:helix-turn-helix domain-containing protein [Ktedonosporobacter sp.]